jgi:copper oxidase (laccase) domain-containing protein
VAGIVPDTVAAMTSVGAVPAAIRAHVSPCISRDAFEVGPEVAARFDDAVVHRRDDWARPHVDLKAALRRQLADAGLVPDHVEVSPRCTYTDRDTFYSHRAADGTTGRMFGAVVLRN